MRSWLAKHAEALRGKLRNRIEGEGSAGAERIADGKEAGVHQPDDVAWVGLFNGFPITAEEPVRSRHPDLPAQPRVIDHHVLLEAARDNTQKRHPIAMLRVHVRLNLEHKAGELVVRRLHQPLRAHARAWRGGELEKGVQEGLDAEVGQRAAEENRREFAGEKTVAIELGARAGQQGDLFLQRTIGFAERLSQARMGERLHPSSAPGAGYAAVR